MRDVYSVTVVNRYIKQLIEGEGTLSHIYVRGKFQLQISYIRTHLFYIKGWWQCHRLRDVFRTAHKRT